MLEDSWTGRAVDLCTRTSCSALRRSLWQQSTVSWSMMLQYVRMLCIYCCHQAYLHPTSSGNTTLFWASPPSLPPISPNSISFCFTLPPSLSPSALRSPSLSSSQCSQKKNTQILDHNPQCRFSHPCSSESGAHPSQILTLKWESEKRERWEKYYGRESKVQQATGKSI